MPFESDDAQMVARAIQELRDAVLFHAAYTQHPDAFPSVDTRDANYMSHSIKEAF
jgi:hypothetical protein